MNGRAERETYIGHEAQHMRGVLALKHPIKNGIIQNWDKQDNYSEQTWILDLASHILENVRGSKRSPNPANGSAHESTREPPADGGNHV